MFSKTSIGIALPVAGKLERSVRSDRCAGRDGTGGDRIQKRSARGGSTGGRPGWLQGTSAPLYRGAVRGVAAAFVLSVGVGAVASGCEQIDPGPNFVISSETFDADWFFCHVEPEYLFAKKCGSGEASDGQGNCHYNPSAVSGMPLSEHAPIDCGGGDRPVSRAQLGSGSAAEANFQAASLVMSRDYLTAPIVVRPGGANHPRQVVAPGDPSLEAVRQWAAR